LLPQPFITVMTDRIEVQVPDGYPPMCEPVKAANRADNVVVAAASKKYLPAMVNELLMFKILFTNW
jgi:hypothetical protein